SIGEHYNKILIFYQFLIIALFVGDFVVLLCLNQTYPKNQNQGQSNSHLFLFRKANRHVRFRLCFEQVQKHLLELLMAEQECVVKVILQLIFQSSNLELCWNKLSLLVGSPILYLLG